MSFYNKITLTFVAIAAAWVLGYTIYYQTSETPPLPEELSHLSEEAK